MIIRAFSEYLKEFNDDIPAVVLLSGWLQNKLSKSTEDNIDRVIHEEIAFSFDENGEIAFKGKSKSGRILLESLYNFAESYEQQKFSRWVHNLKPGDFKDHSS